LAQKLLNERGHRIGQQEIEVMRKDRISKLANPDRGQQWWIVVGYISAILGGVLGVIVIALLGVIIGYHLLTYKKTLPTGDRVYGYSKKDKLHGQIIFVLATVSMTLGTYFRTLG
jgi:hypothetical protein